MNRDETREYLKEHTIEETCKHFRCTFKQLFSVVNDKNVKKNGSVTYELSRCGW